MNDMPFMNLGSCASNFGSFIKNFTSGVLYGVTSNGSMFNLMPTTYSPVGAGVYVETHVIQDPSGRFDTLANKTYKAPIQNNPVYIEEHNLLLFYSAEERTKMIDMYGGSGAKLVQAYAAGMISLLNASFKAITCLNSDREFYMISSSGIVRVPSVSEEYRIELLRKYKLDPAILDINDVFLINTVVKNSGIDGHRGENVMSTSIKEINRDDLIKDQPIIFENDGLILFDGKKQAEAFVSKHGTAANYMINQALEATHQIHDDELADMNEQAAKDKRGMFETFGLMGGTSILSILTENVIKSYNEGDDSGETTKKAFKILAIGVIGLATIGGMYTLYRHISDKREKAKKEKERLERYAND